MFTGCGGVLEDLATLRSGPSPSKAKLPQEVRAEKVNERKKFC